MPAFPRPLTLVLSSALFLPIGISAQTTAQTPIPPAASNAPKTEAQLNDEAARANGLYQQSQPLAALPLYQDLHTQRPQNPLYTERLAMGWIAAAGASTSPQEQAADRNRARALFLEAQAAGDHSDLLQVMLEKLGPAEPASGTGGASTMSASDPRVPGGPFAQAELLFSKGDIQGAIALYQKSWQQHPDFYSAPLYAGDAEYKLNHYDQASVWFERAIAINTDIETAHRYWADCLMKAGKPQEARRQYIEAFIADPYSKGPRLAFRAWARIQNVPYIPPPIQLGARAESGANGGSTITLDQKLSPPFIAAWTTFALTATVWQRGEFAKRYPNEKVYRHSLAEESASLHAALKSLRNASLPESGWDSTFRALADLEKDNMIECWILLDAPDNGTAQDYLAYRAAHRDLLRAYIEKYDLHPA